ncbi:hypothetical protein NHX12_023017 [Muraenolepis orangiensis]|uniref:Uncharacterized protein n=1 Tax=Muraenolepis orangiensis TaxID=630683 RepID=A0A9Q0EP56_9TELE|nr:hypothetical protein NHX12_023017 [Muraenolepis orangiensis]
MSLLWKDQGTRSLFRNIPPGSLVPRSAPSSRPRTPDPVSPGGTPPGPLGVRGEPIKTLGHGSSGPSRTEACRGVFDQENPAPWNTFWVTGHQDLLSGSWEEMLVRVH